MQARMKNPAMVLPDAMQPIQQIREAVRQGGVDESTLELVHLRVSQVNGCSPCVHAGAGAVKKAGATEDQLFAIAAWRETPYFDEAERAALALAEAATRLSDRSDPVSDEVWQAVEKHYDEEGRAALVLLIAVTNMFNRINVTTAQPAGVWG